MFYLQAGLIGILSGVTSGLFGVGGGIIMVPAMVLWLKVDPKTAIGTSLAVIIPTAVVGAFRHHDLGQVNWRLAGVLMVGAAIAAWSGASLTRHVDAGDLKRAFGGFLVLVGLRLVLFR